MKPNWITLSKSSGSGDASIAVSAALHTGRAVRTGSITVKGSGVSPDKTISVSQAAKSVFVNLGSTEYSVSKAGGNAVITGTTNSMFLNFKLLKSDGTAFTNQATTLQFYDAKGDLVAGTSHNNEAAASVSLPAEFTSDNGAKQASYGNTSSSGQKINTSPATYSKTNGEAAAYSFSITVPVGANTSILEQKIKLQVDTQDESVFAQTTIKLAAGAAFCNVTPTSLSFAAAGESKSFSIDSNTSWTVE